VTTGPGNLLVIADDSADMRWLIRTALTDSFDDAIEVADGRELFWTVETLLAKHRPSDPRVLVVSDIYMPVYSGIDVLEAWQDRDWPFPLVAISSFPDAELRRRIRAIGGVLLPKPFTTRELRETVNHVMH
jgi:two-component system response regulator (stage 0 sporulation protein F)